ncbi:hypothetical protein DVA86_07030 [Streptomyces armeniacus]|uniref:Proline rich protein membrane protein n=1 Tax=Streptomyces armeniacus TaxID=83291 RepID=A0A345XZS8_9ACTN|nr:hypothetical protein DVA86_07030 [Streptomyces armeniacus]
MPEPPPESAPAPSAAVPPGPVRLWRWRRNPLRRPSDLLQAWLGLALTAAVLAAVPLTAVLTYGAVHRVLHDDATQEARAKHRTTAEVLDDVPQHPEPDSQEAAHTRYPARVRFTAPDASTRTGSADVRPGLPAGSTVRVWTDDRGDLTGAPPSAEEIRNRALGWSLAASAVVAVAGAAAYGIAGRVLDRHRMAAWEHDWSETATRWTASS